MSSSHPWITSRDLGTRGATVLESNEDATREVLDLGIVDSRQGPYRNPCPSVLHLEDDLSVITSALE